MRSGCQVSCAPWAQPRPGSPEAMTDKGWEARLPDDAVSTGLQSHVATRLRRVADDRCRPASAQLQPAQLASSGLAIKDTSSSSFACSLLDVPPSTLLR